MKKLIVALSVTLLLMGCSSKNETSKNITPKLVVGKTLTLTQLKDQNDKVESISPTTTTLFFSFAKETGHMCNEFLESKPTDFLAKHHAVYIADVSPAPSIIKSIFILPDLRKLPFKIMLINDDKLSAQYSKGIDKEKIVVVHISDSKITKIETLNSKEDLEKLFQ